MGVQAKMFSNKYHTKKGSKKQINKKEKKGKSYVIENIELLSKEQMKKVAKNPKNSIRPSGKRKRKMLKRLRHSDKEKNSMQVETNEAGPSTSKEADSTQAQETSEMEEDSDEEMS